MSRPTSLTYEQCHAYFDLPVAQAASMLGVSRPTISKVLRAHGIPRWPYRKLRAQGKLDEWRQRREAAAHPTPEHSPDPPLDHHSNNPALHHHQPHHQHHMSHVEHHPPHQPHFDQHVVHRDSPHLPQSPSPQVPWDHHAWSATVDSFPSTDVSANPDLVLTVPEQVPDAAVTPAAQSHVITDHFPPVDPHVFTSLSSEWECEESLDEVPSQPPHSEQLDGQVSCDDASEERGGGVQRALFGDLTWSRGIFSPDGKGGMSFRFVATDVDAHTDDQEPVDGVMRISESDLYAAVGSQRDDPLDDKAEVAVLEETE
eukprot:GFKZ01003281.1.p1 GENE.GFKZ01003281.1~~GFKZ01003281.1.p1  ORF type:complete len:341 (-),score=48.13 GFKZ01003281.1:457-1398(-)